MRSFAPTALVLTAAALVAPPTTSAQSNSQFAVQASVGSLWSGVGVGMAYTYGSASPSQYNTGQALAFGGTSGEYYDEYYDDGGYYDDGYYADSGYYGGYHQGFYPSCRYWDGWGWQYRCRPRYVSGPYPGYWGGCCGYGYGSWGYPAYGYGWGYGGGFGFSLPFITAVIPADIRRRDPNSNDFLKFITETVFVGTPPILKSWQN